ncbi:TonB-dependent receptor [Sphingomonas naphthae]|uniref:TonB-dependent receptor n=1 Tax=Sphingomonas naphthae TaxID=1813468 RepID=A0ABY7TP72_9SPHN|nr:TonB-dependent receptor [Sphingomonas naphthae]WCT73994.1 TonB-dependent receptor [Sphingomonas naphthae]
MRGRGLSLASAAGVIGLIGAAPLPAQTTAPVTASPAEPDSGEILVTARKRQETLMDVPVVATAIGGEKLQNLQIQDMKSLATVVPGLSLGGSLLSVGVQASLRGVGTSALDPGVDQSVSLNIDGMALSQGLAFASGMFDVGQIEVLKGPQSLFYGKSSPGGVISLRTADPTDRFELIGRAGYEFEARERRIEAIVSGPLSETFKVRLAGTVGKQDGFYYNRAQGIAALGSVTPAKRHGSGTDYKLRATILWDPSEKFDARLKLNRVSDDFDHVAIVQNVLCPDGTGPFNGRQFIDSDCRLDRNAPLVDLDPAAFPGIVHNGVPYNTTKQTFGTAELNYHFTPQLTLTSATAYYLANSRNMVNAAATSAGAGLISATNRFQRRQFTEEVRLASDFSSPLNFTLGGYLERTRFYDDVIIGGNTRLGAPATIQKGIKTVHVEAESLFGQVLYKIVPELELAAGARWTSERRNINPFNTISGTPVFVALAVPKIKADNVAPEISLTYRPSSDLTLFASAKRGYKSGSFNVSTPPFTGENNSFGDEKVEGGEIGLKSRLANRRLMFNLAGYYYKYTGLQVGANVQSTAGVTVTRTLNAGKARNYGLEAEMTFRPEGIQGLDLNAALNWNNSKYTSLLNVPCYGGQLAVEGCNLLFSPTANAGLGGFTAQDRSGIPLLRAPRWSANFGFSYERPIGADWTLLFASNNQYQSRSLVDLAYIYYQKSYIKADATLTLKHRDRWEFALIGKNINNELTSGNCANSNRQGGQTGGIITGSTVRGAAGIDEVGCYMDRGRELWVRATLRY